MVCLAIGIGVGLTAIFEMFMQGRFYIFMVFDAYSFIIILVILIIQTVRKAKQLKLQENITKLPDTNNRFLQSELEKIQTNTSINSVERSAATDFQWEFISNLIHIGWLGQSNHNSNILKCLIN